MSPAFDAFERSLVKASREIFAERQRAAVDDSPQHSSRRSLRQRLGALRRPTKLGVALVAVCSCGGVAFAAATLIPGSASARLPEFTCEINTNESAGASAITGSPLIDCAAQWPQADFGRRAPKLQLWGKDSGTQMTALAAPATMRNPLGRYSSGWSRLPASWHINLTVTMLNDQLGNISMPFNVESTNDCSYQSEDVRAVHQILDADRLNGWHIVVQGQHETTTNGTVNGRPYAHGCYETSGSVDLGKHEVTLRQFLPVYQSTRAAPANPPGAVTASAPAPKPNNSVAERRQRTIDKTRHNIRVEYLQLRTLYLQVNGQLSQTCESVPAATMLWKRAASASGFTIAQPSFLWRPHPRGFYMNSSFFHHYVLYRQPASQHTGDCAHVLVMGFPTDNIVNVYVARIAP